MHEELDVSVVVPTYSRADCLRRLLGALSRQTLAPHRYEVVVAIDGSRDGTLELVTDYPAPYRLSSIWQENKGRAAARNEAIRRSSAAIVVFLDDDMEPAPECVEAHLNSHSRGRRRCVLGATPIDLTPGDPPVAKYFQKKFEAHLRRLAEPDHHFVARDFYSGNLSLEQRLLFEVGLFDESFTRYGNEDVDLALRLLAAGAEIVYEPRALARQRLNKNLIGAIDDAQSKGQTALFLARKNPESLPELRLATYEQASIRWRLVRRVLLSASERSRLVPPLLTRLTRLLERSGVRLPWGYYDLLLDFFFWLGVERGLEDLDGDGAATPERFLLH
jgi:glycosyltransferase involved in cell wall biosynthesis